MTGEQRALELYPDNDQGNPLRGLYNVSREGFIKGWNECAKKKNKQIVALKKRIKDLEYDIEENNKYTL